MPRTPRGAGPAPARAKAVFAALLASAALALSACESTGLSSLGSGWFGGDEAGDGKAPAASSSEGTGAEGTGSDGTGGKAADGGDSGRVVEIISSEDPPSAPPAGQAPADPAGEADALAAIPADPAINDDPEQLIGMGPASLNAFLGAPELIRREAPASLWQYRADGCVLDVVLYPDRTGDKVTYLEARENGATKIAPRDCLGKLLRARFDGTSG